MGQLKYHNGTTWVSIEQTTADYTALVFNDPVVGLTNGTNTVFTTTRNFSSISVYLNGVKQFPGAGNDYTVTGANQITFTNAPDAGSVITADFSTSASFTATGTNSFVVKQAVTGLVNGSNATYTTASGYIGGTLEVYVNGLRQAIAHVTETNPGSGTFTLDTAPLTGDIVEVGYMMAGVPSGNADTTDGFHASQTVAANTIPVTGADSKLPQAVIPGIAFKARRSTNQNTTSGGTIDILFDGIYYNYGSGYNSATGLFTAPVTGIYTFEVSAFTETATTGRSFLTCRGTATTGTPVGTIARSTERGLDIDSTYVRRTYGFWELYMAAGETFGVNLYTSAVNNINHADTWMAGHLVMQVGV